MKLSHLAYGAVGYVLGARAGQERYDQIVRAARRFAGSQTVQSTAGVVQARLDVAAAQARQALAARIGGQTAPDPTPRVPTVAHNGTNGYRRASAP